MIVWHTFAGGGEPKSSSASLVTLLVLTAGFLFFNTVSLPALSCDPSADSQLGNVRLFPVLPDSVEVSLGLTTLSSVFTVLSVTVASSLVLPVMVEVV